MLSVANSCHYNKNFKNGKNVYRQMPSLGNYPQKSPPLLAKARMQKPQGGGRFLVQIPRGALGEDGYGKNGSCLNSLNYLIEQLMAFFMTCKLHNGSNSYSLLHCVTRPLRLLAIYLPLWQV